MSDSAKPPFSIGRLPGNVEAAIVSPEGNITYILKPYPVSNKWPDGWVDSSAFKKLPTPEKLYSQNKAFLEAAILCCESAGKAPEKLQWSQGAVYFYSINLETELFLKTSISRITNSPPLPTHSISKLLRRYTEVLPDREFHFPTPWAASASEIEEWVGGVIFEEIDRSPDQLYRYGVGRDGASSAGIQVFSPSNMYDYSMHLSGLWEKAWERISKNG
ncbi:MAG TPA: hypothetical protein PK517_03385 [Nitrosomonas sp.]|nr:hypothetical protein [Nitrosomonas sp.]